MAGLTARAVAEGEAAPVIIHWAGLKRSRLTDMPGGDILAYFEREYFRRLPAGWLRRPLALAWHFFGELRLRLKLRAARWRK